LPVRCKESRLSGRSTLARRTTTTSENCDWGMLMASGVQVYGTDWCRVTFSVREYLMNSRIPYDYYNIERDSHADEFVLTMNDGRRRFPLIVVKERVLTSPTLNELQRVLDEYGVHPATLMRAGNSRSVRR
jgi:glutaredoxin